MRAQTSSSKRSRKPTALVIDRDADVHRFVHVCLGKEFDVHHAYFPKLAISLLERGRFTLLVASEDMDEYADASDLREKIVEYSRAKGAPVVRMSFGSADRRFTIDESEHAVGKPLSEEAFYESLSRVLNDEVSVPAYAT